MHGANQAVGLPPVTLQAIIFNEVTSSKSQLNEDVQALIGQSDFMHHYTVSCLNKRDCTVPQKIEQAKCVLSGMPHSSTLVGASIDNLKATQRTLDEARVLLDSAKKELYAHVPLPLSLS